MGIQKYVGKKVWDMMLSRMEHCSNPAVFNDPVAEKTEWSYLEGGGSNFQTHKLVHVGKDRIEYKISFGNVLFSLLSVLVGVGAGVFGVLMSDNPLLFSLVGLAFFGAGSAMLYFGTRPVVFDKRKGLFWKGKMPLQHGSAQLRNRKNCANLRDIHALQVLSGKHSDQGEKSYRSYGINLVFKDGFRISAVNHADKRKIREDAEVLSEFLGKPLWDASEMQFIDKEMFRTLYKQAQEHPEKLEEQVETKLEELKRKFKIK